eukprot:1390853-Rhodomonas_salina.1
MHINTHTPTLSVVLTYAMLLPTDRPRVSTDLQHMLLRYLQYRSYAILVPHDPTISCYATISTGCY